MTEKGKERKGRRGGERRVTQGRHFGDGGGQLEGRKRGEEEERRGEKSIVSKVLTTMPALQHNATELTSERHGTRHTWSALSMHTRATALGPKTGPKHTK